MLKYSGGRASERASERGTGIARESYGRLRDSNNSLIRGRVYVLRAPFYRAFVPPRLPLRAAPLFRLVLSALSVSLSSSILPTRGSAVYLRKILTKTDPWKFHRARGQPFKLAFDLLSLPAFLLAFVTRNATNLYPSAPAAINCPIRPTGRNLQYLADFCILCIIYLDYIPSGALRI